jgi:hypothetical protein
MTTYTVTYSDGTTTERGGDDIEAATIEDALAEAEIRCRDWISGGDWGSDGAAITIDGWVEVSDGEDEDRADVSWSRDADEDLLIHAALGYYSEYARCDHDWTSDHDLVGGLDSNPGVWSLGGTAMSFTTACRSCGLRRHEHRSGPQRNPGEAEVSITFEAPEETD